MSNATWVVLLGIVSSVLTLIGAAWISIKYVWGQMLEQMQSTLRIEKQVTPNGGNSDSLADRVVRVEAGQKELHARLSKLETSTLPFAD